MPNSDVVQGNKNELSGDFRGSQNFFDSTVNMAWSPPLPYDPPPPPAPDDLPTPGPLPPGSHVPYPRHERFTGRGEQLLELASLLVTSDERRVTSEEHSSLVTRHSSLVTISSGIGGVGKTALAVEFAYRYGRFFHGVHWVAAENPAAVDAAIATCGQQMGLHPTFGALPLPDQVALVERAWAGPEARLIIFDNLEDEALLARRPKSGGARLLATSRRERWDDPAARVRRLGPLSAPEGVRLLQRVLSEGEGRPQRTDVAADDLRAIAAALGELPLALRLAGAYLRRYRRESAAGYLAALNRPDLLAHRSLDPGPGERGVARSFALSFDRLRPAEDAKDAAALALLARAACFAPGEPLPVDLLLTTLDAPDNAPTADTPPALSSTRHSPLVTRHSPEDALERLLELGLLEDVDDSGERVRLHRLLAVFVVGEIGWWEEISLKEAKGSEGAKEEEVGVMAAAREAVEKRVLDLAQQQNKARDLRALQSWETHWQHIVDGAFHRDDGRAGDLCNEMGIYLRTSHSYAGAKIYHERALAICVQVYGLDHLRTAACLNNLGMVLLSTGALAEARPYFELALDICRKILGLENLNTALALNNLGSLLQAMGDYKAALPYLATASAIHERILGPLHPDTALSINNLGYLLQIMGDLDTAQPYYERALSILELTVGPNHTNVAMILNNLGLLLQAKGELSSAMDCFEESLAIRERVFGLDHPDTARAIDNLGALHLALHDLVLARSYFQRALVIRQRILGQEHSDTAVSLNNMGVMFYYENDYLTAASYIKQALAIRERVLGPHHPLTAQARANLAALSSVGEESNTDDTG